MNRSLDNGESCDVETGTNPESGRGPINPDETRTEPTTEGQTGDSQKVGQNEVGESDAKDANSPAGTTAAKTSSRKTRSVRSKRSPGTRRHTSRKRRPKKEKEEKVQAKEKQDSDAGLLKQGKADKPRLRPPRCPVCGNMALLKGKRGMKLICPNCSRKVVVI